MQPHERSTDLEQGVPEGNPPVVPLQSGWKGPPGVGLEHQPMKIVEDFVELRGILLFDGVVPKYGAYLLRRCALPNMEGVGGCSGSHVRRPVKFKIS